MPSPHECHLTAEVANRVGLADRHAWPASPKARPRDPPQTCADARHTPRRMPSTS